VVALLPLAEAGLRRQVRTSSSTIVKWFVFGTTTHSALTSARLQAAASAKLWRMNSVLSSPPTAATMVEGGAGLRPCTRLTARALVASRRSASLRDVPMSGVGSKTPLSA
jgi:hypothetical protein